MSLNKSAAPHINSKLLPSRKLLVIQCLLFGGALVLLWFADLFFAIKAVATLLLLMTFILGLISFGWLFLPVDYCKAPCLLPVDRLLRTGEGRWQLVLRGNHVIDSELQLSSTVHPTLTVLNFKLRDMPWYCARRSVVLMTDAIAPDEFRQLRVLLKSHTAG